MDPDQQLRNLRDFLLVYNRMTEICFQRCTSNFNYRNLTMDEERCVDSCAGKLIRSNHRLMGTYVQLMPQMVQRRMEEMESKVAENAKAAEAAAAAAAAEAATPSPEAVGTATTEASPAFQTPISSPPPQIPSLVTPPVTDVGAEVNGSVLKPTLDFTTEVDAAVSKSTEVTLSAATPHTPLTEAVNSSVLNTAGTEPSFTPIFPLPPIAGSHIDSECSPPLLSPPNLTALPEDVPVLTAASTVSKSESLSGQEKTPDLPPPPGQ